MTSKSSQGSIPAGLTLYTFEYPEHETVPCEGRSDQLFLTSDEAAAVWAGRFRAHRAVNVLSGRVIRAKSP